MSYKKPLVLSCMVFLMIYSPAQVDKETSSPTKTVSAEDIERTFSKGINNFIIQQNFGYTRSKPENSDNHTSNIDLRLDYNRFVVDGFAIGAGFELSSVRSEINNVDVVKTTDWILYGNVMYGRTFNNFNLYGKASVGFGKRNFDTPGQSGDDDLFGYRFEIGSPIHLFNGGGNYITPFISYNFLQQKDDAVKYQINDFDFGVQFQSFSPCSGYQCDRSRRFSGNMYDQGRSYIGYTSMGEFGFGSTKTDPGIDPETDISGGSFNFEYGYYLTRDIALGAGVSWSGATEDDGMDKVTNSEFSFMPMITLNAPSKDQFENFFLQGGYGFGFEKIKFGSSEIKYNTTDLTVNIGYNHFFGKYLAFTPKIGYEWETFKNTDTNAKDKQRGLQFGLGCSLHF